MFGLGPATKIFIAIESVDMRKGSEGLHGLVRDHLGHDPLSGHLFLFTNRTRTRLKALVWDGSGLCGTPIPITWLGLLEIQSIDEHSQFLGSHRDAPRVLLRGP